MARDGAMRDGGACSVLDASAFYAGLPFRSPERFSTTPQVLDEVRHIKMSHDAIGMLVQTGRLAVRQAGAESTSRVISKATETGDRDSLSEQDISVLALCLDTGGQLVTDDFAVSNVARNMMIPVQPLMTGGIRTVGRWIHYCPGCRRSFRSSSECPLCGNALRKRLVGKRR